MSKRKNSSNNNIILDNIMSNKRDQGTKYLTALGRNALASAKDKVDKIVNLYGDGKISQKRTAEKIILKLINQYQPLFITGVFLCPILKIEE